MQMMGRRRGFAAVLPTRQSAKEDVTETDVFDWLAHPVQA